MSHQAFYQSLSPIEKEYWHKLDTVFQQVNPQKPAQGIEALLKRAKAAATQENIPLAQALEEMLKGAMERTERRLRLLGQCNLNPVQPENQSARFQKPGQ